MLGLKRGRMNIATLTKRLLYINIYSPTINQVLKWTFLFLKLVFANNLTGGLQKHSSLRKENHFSISKRRPINLNFLIRYQDFHRCVYISFYNFIVLSFRKTESKRSSSRTMIAGAIEISEQL